MKITTEYHRNGVSGTGFVAAIVEPGKNNRNDWPARALCIVLPKRADDDGVNCFVLDLDMAAAGNIKFGHNSWRGDNFLCEFGPAIEKAYEEQHGHNPHLLTVEE